MKKQFNSIFVLCSGKLIASTECQFHFVRAIRVRKRERESNNGQKNRNTKFDFSSEYLNSHHYFNSNKCVLFLSRDSGVKQAR